MFSLRCWLEDKALKAHVDSCDPKFPGDIEAAKLRARVEAFQEVIRYIETRNRNQWPHKKAGSE